MPVNGPYPKINDQEMSILRPFELNGRSLNAVDVFQNLLGFERVMSCFKKVDNFQYLFGIFSFNNFWFIMLTTSR